jgi:hypothetical protein
MKRILPRLDALEKRVADADAAAPPPPVRWHVHFPDTPAGRAEAERLQARHEGDPHVTIVHPSTNQPDPDR